MTGTNTLQECWAIVLDVDVNDIDDDLNWFDAGGDSVKALRLVEAARELGWKLDLETVFNYPDFQDMLANSEEAVATDPMAEASSLGLPDAATVQACADSCGVGPELIEDIFPSFGLQKGFMKGFMKSHNQRGSWLLQLVLELEGVRDTALVRRAFDTIRAKNQVLRTRLVKVGSEVLQVALKEPTFWHDATDLTDYMAKDSELCMWFWHPSSAMRSFRNPRRHI